MAQKESLYEFIQSFYKDILLEVMEKKMEATFLGYIANFPSVMKNQRNKSMDNEMANGIFCGSIGTIRFPELGGTLFGGPHNKDYNMLGSILGSLIPGNNHIIPSINLISILMLILLSI